MEITKYYKPNKCPICKEVIILHKALSVGTTKKDWIHKDCKEEWDFEQQCLKRKAYFKTINKAIAIIKEKKEGK